MAEGDHGLDDYPAQQARALAALLLRATQVLEEAGYMVPEQR